MTKTYRGALLLALASVLLLPGVALLLPTSAAAAVPAGVTKGLDWLHTRQRSDGGFAYSSANGSATETPWIMLAIAAGHNGPSRWKVAGRSAVTFLQGTALDTAAKNSGNPPEYYALCILAYRAAGRTDLLTSAGSTQIDLIGKLKSYQSLTDVYYSPATPATTAAATETTAWAVLGLVAAHQSGPPVSTAVTWLETPRDTLHPNEGGPNSDGGYGSSPGYQSSTTVTALVMQALRAGGAAATGPLVQGGAGFLKSMQRGSGGFMDTASGFVSAPSTAWAIEGLWAAGMNPTKLAQASHTPYTFLASLRQRNGSYFEFPSGDIGDVMGATTLASIALAGRTLPLSRGPNALTHFAPVFGSGSVGPKNGARFASRTVLVQAAYHDNANGTGTEAAAIRVIVDGKSKTKAAHITASHLRLQLTKLADGSHTVVITVYDWAGNAVRIQRSFTVAIPTSGGGSTGGGTHPGGSTGGSTGGSSSTGGGTVIHPSARPTPTATISPTQGVSPGITLTPTPSSSFPGGPTNPSPSASVTGQLAGSSDSGGGGNTAAVVGTTLAALVPLGFAASWLVRRRLLGVMGGASRGEILPSGSSVWQRFWKSPGGPPPPGGGR